MPLKFSVLLQQRQRNKLPYPSVLVNRATVADSDLRKFTDYSHTQHHSATQLGY
jgi:hypothetical protein